MRRIGWLPLLASMALFPAYAKTQYFLRAQPSTGQSVTWQHGDQFLEDIQPKSDVAFAQVRRSLPDKQSAFQLFIMNRSVTPFIFGAENVEIECPDGTRVRMITYDELVGKLRRDVKRREVAARLGTALMLADSPQPVYGKVEINGVIDGQAVDARAHFSAYGQAQEEAEIAERAIVARQGSGMAELDDVLQTTTVMPGKSFGGIIAYEPPAAFGRSKVPLTVRLLITTGSEQHVVTAIAAPMP